MSSDDSRIRDLLIAWEEAAASGRTIPAESLCTDCPELLLQVRVGIEQLQTLRRENVHPDTAPVSSLVTPTVLSGPDHPTGTWAAPGLPVDQSPGSFPNVPGCIGDYELLNEIARGGMGVVYKARHIPLDRIVALKMIRAGELAGHEEIQRFRTEARAAAQLDHPGIVPIHEVGELAGRHFFSMGFVEGEPLSQRIAGGVLEPHEAADLMRQVADAVAYAHSRGILHRDLKPGNILVDCQGRARVTDFGLAKWADDESELTSTGQILGTPSYMPPEQARGELSEIGPRSDVWSLGAVLYCLLTGRPPFQSPSMMATLRQVLDEEAARPRKLNPGIDPELEAICLKCLRKQPQKRWSSAAELSTVLTEYLARGKAPANPARLRWPIVGASLLGVVLLLGAIVLSLRTAHGEVTVELGEGVKPEDVRIEVRGDGQLKILAASEGWTIEVKEGTYAVQLAGGTDRFQLNRQEVVATRDGKTVVRVTIKPAPPTTTPATPVVTNRLAGFQQPGFEEWVQRVRRLPAREQVQAVVEELQKRNPGFDGEVAVLNESGMPTPPENPIRAISFIADHVTDLSPVRALPELNRLMCYGSKSPKSGVLTDLSPLRGLPLTQLSLHFTHVEDLSPLTGMKLHHFSCASTEVRDISPLKGMPLTSLQLEWSRVSDLTPLLGMPLVTLNISATPVTDLSPLANIPLKELRLSDLKVTDVSALSNLPLEHLEFRHLPVKDFSPLRGLPLKSIQIGNLDPRIDGEWVTFMRSQSSLETINQMPVAEFWKMYDAGEFGRSAVSGKPSQSTPENQAFFDAVAKMPAGEQVRAVARELQNRNPGFDGKLNARIDQGHVREIDLSGAAIQNKAPLAALVQLEALNLSGTSVYNLDSLQRLTRLKSLNCSNTAVQDLRPVSGLPLEVLDCRNTSIRDLSPLSGMPLVHLGAFNVSVCNEPALRVLQSLPELQTLNGQPLATFLARREELEHWRKTLPALPPEQQYQLVLNKLRDFNPDFDGKLLEHRIENGAISFLALGDRAKLSDISPLSGLPLRFLNATGRQDGTGVAVEDLTPLRGMPLSELHIGNLPVVDLTPLAGMSLKTFYCNATGVSDLSPLAGMPLTFLNCAWNPVSDLTPLRGMPLSSLDCWSCRVSDFTPLADLPLASLQCGYNPITDLSPLERTPLNFLGCENTHIYDLSPLRRMRLTKLNIRHTPVSDFRCLLELPLEALECSIGLFNAAEEQLVRSLTVKRLNASPAADFSKAMAARQTAAEAFATQTARLPVNDQIAAVQQQLKQLNPDGTAVLQHSLDEGRLTAVTLSLSERARDLTPLRAFPHLRELTISGGPVGLDLSPITSLPLEKLHCSRQQAFRNTAVLRSLKSLQTINGQPAADHLDRLTTQ